MARAGREERKERLLDTKLAKPLVVLLAVLSLAVLGACAGRSSSGGSGAGAGTTVTMQDIQFAPKTLTVKVGQTVRWRNQDSVDHNVVATSGASFRSQAFGQGGTYAYTPTRSGTIKYVCTLHPGMSGTLVVQR
jgi:plastocyanin